MFAIAERMAASGMVFMAHCYAQGDFEAPWRMRRLAQRFPAMQFVALDAMTSPENLDQLHRPGGGLRQRHHRPHLVALRPARGAAGG